MTAYELYKLALVDQIGKPISLITIGYARWQLFQFTLYALNITREVSVTNKAPNVEGTSYV